MRVNSDGQVHQQVFARRVVSLAFRLSCMYSRVHNDSQKNISLINTILARTLAATSTTFFNDGLLLK